MNNSRFVLRAGIITIVAVMLLFLASVSIGGGRPAQAAPLAQDGTDYPFDLGTTTYDEFNSGYPLETGIPFNETPIDGGTLEVPTITFTPTSTLPPNTFLTESAEMSGGLVTPPASETPGPTITAYQSPTAATATPRTKRVPAKAETGGIDWGYFSLGFAVPLLGACGLVLYLLDRRPDLFRQRR